MNTRIFILNGIGGEGCQHSRGTAARTEESIQQAQLTAGGGIPQGTLQCTDLRSSTGHARGGYAAVVRRAHTGDHRKGTQLRNGRGIAVGIHNNQRAESPAGDSEDGGGAGKEEAEHQTDAVARRPGESTVGIMPTAPVAITNRQAERNRG